MSIACYVRSETIFLQVQEALACSGFECERFLGEIALLRTLRRRDFDLILMEANGGQEADEYVSSWLNCRTGESTPVILISSSPSSAQIVNGLNNGADDFIAMPIDPAELVARVHAVLRSYRRRDAMSRIRLLGFELDRTSCSLVDRGAPVDLTPKEFAMTWLFFLSPGTFLSRDAISSAVWGAGSEISSRTIEQHIYKLRKKLNLSDERGVRIRTAYNRGYRLELCSTDSSDYSEEKNSAHPKDN